MRGSSPSSPWGSGIRFEGPQDEFPDKPMLRRLRLVLAGPILVAALAVVGFGLIGGISTYRSLQLLRPARTGEQHYELSSVLPGSESVTFSTADGITLAATYVAPRNGAVIVLVHGFDSDRLQLLEEAELLVQHGYGALLFDQRAHGVSGGSTSTWGYLESGDVQRAVDYVIRRGGVTSGHVGLLGFSIGANAVVREAGGDLRVGAVVNEATFGSVRDEFRYMFGRYGVLSQLPALWAIQAAGLDLNALEIDQQLCSIAPRPLLLVYGLGDPNVPPSQAQRMASAACQPSELLMIDTSEHGGYVRSAPTIYPERLVTFLDGAFAPGAS